ncbi:hypothetical protein AZKH_0560 [Azoarcus sp. KH32C]|nr:hypothetical protein AZKH_0560 [Azoarcus sp. KH32C]
MLPPVIGVLEVAAPAGRQSRWTPAGRLGRSGELSPPLPIPQGVGHIATKRSAQERKPHLFSDLRENMNIFYMTKSNFDTVRNPDTPAATVRLPGKFAADMLHCTTI